MADSQGRSLATGPIFPAFSGCITHGGMTHAQHVAQAGHAGH
jgi:hypothetical protein